MVRRVLRIPLCAVEFSAFCLLLGGIMSKTSVITGVTSGIGAEYARHLASDGYNLVIKGRRQEIIQKLIFINNIR